MYLMAGSSRRPARREGVTPGAWPAGRGNTAGTRAVRRPRYAALGAASALAAGSPAASGAGAASGAAVASW